MSVPKTKQRVHIISKPGKDNVGTKRYWLLFAVAQKAAEAFTQGFYLEAITLTESLLATRLESRLAWVRSCQNKSKEVRFRSYDQKLWIAE